MDQDRENEILQQQLPNLIKATLNLMWLVHDAKTRGNVPAIDSLREARDYHRSLCGAIKTHLHKHGLSPSAQLDWNALYKREFRDQPPR